MVDFASPPAVAAEAAPVATYQPARGVGWQALAFAAAVVAIVVFAIGLRIGFGPHIRDDAYITLRYAANIAAGQGFVFNPGEHVLGTTTPLYALVLAALAALGAVPTTTAVVLGIAADAAAMVVLGRLAARSLDRTGVVFTLLVYALLSPIVSYAVSGMETSFYMLLILSSVLAYAAGRMRLAGVLCALVVLTRPDGAILAAVLLLHALVWRRSEFVGFGVVCVGVLAPWLAFATVYFGSPLPQSMLAKIQMGATDPLLSLHNFVWYFSDRENRWFLALTPVFLLGVAGVLRSKRELAVLLVMAWGVLYATAYILSNKFLFPNSPFEWYFVPLLAPFALGIGAGLSGLLSFTGSQHGKPRSWRRYAAGLCTAAVLILGYNGVLQYQRLELGRLVSGREEVYAQLASTMREMGIQSEHVAAYEIGAFAYYYPGPILDLLGLVSPQVDANDSSKVIASVRPPWIMAYADMLPTDVLGAEWFRREYKPVHALGTWEGRRTTLFRRFALPANASGWSPSEAVLGGTMQLQSIDVQTGPQGAQQEVLHVTLIWTALQEMSRRNTVFIHLLGANGHRIGQHDGEPQGNQAPTNSWRVGETVVDKHDLVVDADSLGEPTLVIGAYETGSRVNETGAVDHLLSWSSPTAPQLPHELRVPLSLLER